MIKPLQTHLTILQQEGYQIGRFFKWWTMHPITYFISHKKPFVSTTKTKTLVILSTTVFSIFLATTLFTRFYYLSAFLITIFCFEPFVFLFLALGLLMPYEKVNRFNTKNRIRHRIIENKGMINIGITGSFGKTSVKDFLFEILSGWKDTVKTPESYNTLFGIAKVVDLEIISKTKYFVCEMGAYVRGEIAELCYMIPPQYAILTAIGTQHLERFKNISNTTHAKFELIDSVIPEHSLVNLDNPYIAQRLKESKYSNVYTYSLLNSKANFYVAKHKLSSDGTTFTLKYQGKTLEISTSLFGTSNLYNLTASISMSLILGVPLEIIKSKAAEIMPSPHRLEIKKINNAVLIDNAFSSNEEGFISTLNDLKKLKGRKVLITPGIIELGSSTKLIHKKLGELSSDIFEKFILVGRSVRTESFEEGIVSENRNRVVYIENSTNLWPMIDSLSIDFDWILLENDLPDTF